MPRPRPTIRRYPKTPPKPPVETDLKTLGDAANEAAKREAAQWFFFLTIMVTLAALVGSTTHRVLFLEEPVRVPILSVELSLLGFYVAAPAFLVVMHFYLLAQLQFMAGKVNAFLDAVASETPDGSEQRELALRRLDSFSVAQLMAAERFRSRSLPLWLMVNVTLVLAPLALLLFFQLRFLPHHTESITLWHQALVAADVAQLWWLWPFHRIFKRWNAFAAMAGSFCVVGFSWFLAVIPGDDPRAESLSWARIWLFDGRTDPVTQRPTSLFARRLVLLDQVFLTEAERKAWTETPDEQRDQLARTRVMRGRDLRFAELQRADLRGADLTGAFLTGADLTLAQMQNVNLSRASMQGANLIAARMHRANLSSAQLQGAHLAAAQLLGSILQEVQLQGAILSGAQLSGAVLVEAQLQGANLVAAQMQGAILIGVHLQGAVLDGAQLAGALIVGAQLQGAVLDGFGTRGMVLHSSQVWRLRVHHGLSPEALLHGLDFSSHVPCTELHKPGEACLSEHSWLEWVEKWLAQIPRGELRSQTRQHLAALLAPEDPWDAQNTATVLAQGMQPDPSAVANLLGQLACYTEHQPYLARSVITQIDHQMMERVMYPNTRSLRTYVRDLGPNVASLAARMSAGDCPGTRTLRPDERALLRRIADGRD